MGHISQGIGGLEAALANHDDHHVPLLVFISVVYLSLLSFPVSTSHAPAAEEVHRLQAAPMATAPLCFCSYYKPRSGGLLFL